MSRLLMIFIICGVFISCAKRDEEKTNEAIDMALTHLSSSECSKAIDLLEDVGRDEDNPIYLQVLASAYACRANFNEITFLDEDTRKIDSNSLNLMKSLTTLSLSRERKADSPEFSDIQEALNILLVIDSSAPSQAARSLKFGPRKASDMGLQALYLIIVQLGKFLNFYGNVNSLGAKGAGSANTDEQGAVPSTCFIEYTQATALAFLLGGGGGVCNDMALDDGHPNLLLTGVNLEKTKVRLCQGLMLVTNLMDILNNLVVPQDSSLSALSGVKTSINTIKTGILTAQPGLAALLNNTSQAKCETLLQTNSELNNMQILYALLFEAGLQ